MNEEWNKIYSKNGKLMYEGFTKDGKPFGSGTSYYSNGKKCQEGVFDDKGFVYGKEYYQNGNLRFEGAYKHHKGYGPNYPIFGCCYDEDGNEFFYGELTIKLVGGLSYPKIEKPECYGSIEPKGYPEFYDRKWNKEERKTCGEYYVKIRGKKARRSFIVMLEKNGFKSEDREGAIDSKFPITVDIDRKVYGYMGNATSAAGAASSRVLITAEKFFVLYEIVSSVVIV